MVVRNHIFGGFMNIKNLSLLLAFACAVPIYSADETLSVDQTQEASRDRIKEDAANTKLACTTSGMLLSAAIGVAAGVATKSALVGGIIGGPMFAVPATAYLYLCNKYKKEFDEEAYKRVCDTEDKTFFFTMSTLTAPMAVMLAYGTLYASGFIGYGVGGIIGSAIGKAATVIGATKDTATITAIGLVSAVPAILEAKTEIEKQNLEYKQNGSNYALSSLEKIGYLLPKYCKNIGYAFALLGAASFAYAHA